MNFAREAAWKVRARDEGRYVAGIHSMKNSTIVVPVTYKRTLVKLR